MQSLSLPMASCDKFKHCIFAYHVCLGFPGSFTFDLLSENPWRNCRVTSSIGKILRISRLILRSRMILKQDFSTLHSRFHYPLKKATRIPVSEGLKNVRMSESMLYVYYLIFILLVSWGHATDASPFASVQLFNSNLSFLKVVLS